MIEIKTLKGVSFDQIEEELRNEMGETLFIEKIEQ